MKLSDKNVYFDRKKQILCFFLSMTSLLCHSQEGDKIPLTYQSSLIGVGKTSVYDTYLSPLSYSGTNIGLIHEKLNPTGLAGKRIYTQHLFHLEIAETQNPSGTATQYEGTAEYAFGLFHRFNPSNKIQFFAGVQADALFGLIYNTRNGNNPVSAKFNLNLSLSGMAVYKFRIQQQPIQLRYQVSIPVVGALFTPDFGQSYYEIGKGDTDNLIHYASLHNQRIVRNLFSVELPFRTCTLRLAYMHWLYETQINSLDTRIVSNSFFIGFSKNFYIANGKENHKNHSYVFE
jgi:hypothetical protein